jgi:hypothetical protein
MKRLGSFTDGAVIGGRAFVNEMFAAARERFGPKRRNGARGTNIANAPPSTGWVTSQIGQDDPG